jgi:hypothetical protein
MLSKTIVLLVVLSSLPARAQDQPDSQSQAVPAAVSDPYKNFVGDWIGTSRYLKNGVMKSDPIQLKITELPKGKGMRLDYTYNKPGDPKVDHWTKLISWGKGKMGYKGTIQYVDGANDEVYVADGMEAFEKNGYGIFTFHEPGEKDSPTGKKSAMRCTFRLTHDSFSYMWEMSKDWKNYGLESVFEFTRKVSENQTVTANPATNTP